MSNDQKEQHMNFHPSISDGARPLITCLRSALNGTPPEIASGAFNWESLFRQARLHEVDRFLFPWLAAYFPDAFQARSSDTEGSPTAAWRTAFLRSLPLTLMRHRQLNELLSACGQAGISLIPLKGVWLSETAYDDPAQRPMSDIDLLARSRDYDACHRLLQSLGYASSFTGQNNRFACDQTYRHPDRRWPVELHWAFEPEMNTRAAQPDVEAIWKKAHPSTLQGHPVWSLSHEDQLAHLIQHILHHHFALPLRAYLDLAVYWKRFGRLVDYAELASAGERWRLGSAIPFVLGLTDDLFSVQIRLPSQTSECPISQEQYSHLLGAILNLPLGTERYGETTLQQYRLATARERIRLVWARIFMPRDFMANAYPFARHAWGLPLAWLLRAAHLIRHYGKAIRSMRDNRSPAAQKLDNANVRLRVTEALLRKTKKPE